MPDSHKDIFKYSKYFTKILPSTFVLLLAMAVLGAITGIAALGIIHFGSHISYFFILVYGGSAGIFIVSIPAILTSAIIKIFRRQLLLKHVMFATLVSSASYAVFILIASAFYFFARSGVATYIIILLGNAGIYGYWLIINKFVTWRKKSAGLGAAIQPILNLLMYVPFGKNIIALGLPLGIAMVKMFVGMLVFLAVGYVFLYVVDLPMKRKLNLSSVEMLALMVNQWLYNTGTLDFAIPNFGTSVKLNVDVMVFKGKKGYKAIFVRPDMHYGPFAGTGGGIATASIGNAINKRYGANPFVLHGAVNIENNPISTAQIYNITNNVISRINAMKSADFSRAKGGIGFGSKEPCKAINIEINNLRIITLTKAPTVTEDIDHGVGVGFEKLAEQGNKNAVIIDAHNSRFESASKDELHGIYRGSKYVGRYRQAILQSLELKDRGMLTFGSSAIRLRTLLSGKDLGDGFTAACVFGFDGRKFGMLHFDANNMLPGVRSEIIAHVKKKFGIDAEVYTDDTHSVNSLALTASNVLGRYTSIKELLPAVDSLMERALNSMEPVMFAHERFTIDHFKIWGSNIEEQIKKASLDILKITKRVVPIIIAAGFIIAAWLIYLA